METDQLFSSTGKKREKPAERGTWEPQTMGELIQPVLITLSD